MSQDANTDLRATLDALVREVAQGTKDRATVSVPLRTAFQLAYNANDLGSEIAGPLAELQVAWANEPP